MRRTLGLTAILLVIVATGIWLTFRHPSGDSGELLLLQAQAAARSTDYEGRLTTETFYGGEHRETQAEAHYKAGGESCIHYETPPLDGVILGNDGRKAWRFDKLRNTVLFETSEEDAKSLSESGQFRLLLQNYHPHLEGEDRVAGRQADVVYLHRKEGSGPFKRLWIDRQSHIILRSEEYDSDSRLLVRTVYRTVAFTSQPDNLFQPPKAAKKILTEQRPRRMSLSNLSRAVGFSIILPRHLPAGYVYDGSYLNQCRCGCGMKAAYSRYTDGLSAISVFQCAHCMDNGKPCTIIDSGHSKIASLFHRNMSFVIVGEVSQNDLQKVADSLP